MPVIDTNIRKVFVVRVGRVGDTVMMTPALNALIHYYPDAEFTLLVSPVGKHLMKDFHPHIKQILTWDRNGLLKPWLDRKKLEQHLNANRYQLVICFDTSRHIAKLFTDTNTTFHQQEPWTSDTHAASSYLKFVASVCGREIPDFYNYLPTNPEEAERVDEELGKYGITPDDKVLMIHPTFSGYSKYAIRKRKAKLRKLWHPENYGELCQRINQHHPEIKPLMVLLPDELSFGEQIVRSSKDTVLLLPSESTFDRYKAMLARADVLLTPDSGPMHIASALGTKIIAFFSMKDPRDCGPYMPDSRFTIIRSEDTEHPERGINAIPVDTVYDACIRMFDNDAP